jgi:hypothetical protein
MVIGKVLRWDFMPTLKRNVEIPRLHKVNGHVEATGGFKVSVEPLGFRRKLIWYLSCKNEYQPTLYFIGTKPKMRLIITSVGRFSPFQFRLRLRKPRDETFFAALSEIGTPNYSEVIELPDLDCEIEHIYSISLWTGTDHGSPETHKDMIYLTPFDRDRLTLKVLIPLLYGLVILGSGATINWIVQTTGSNS